MRIAFTQCSSHELISAGFIYVINFGLSQEEIDEQYDIAKALFDSPLPEKENFGADLEKGEYFGYKPFGLREVKPGVPENTEVYNIPSVGQQSNVPIQQYSPRIGPRLRSSALIFGTRLWRSYSSFWLSC